MAVTRRDLSVLVPVLLVDEVLPNLKDTELRVLLIVLRQTRVQGREAASAWLTHRELCRRTGRASEAVCAAVDALVRQQVLRVRDESGNVLTSASNRRARTGRRFYDVLPTRASADARATAKAKTIEENQNTYSFRKAEKLDLSPHAARSVEEAHRIDQEKARIRQRLQHLTGAKHNKSPHS